jgi:mRNA interferase RelE/StbE
LAYSIGFKPSAAKTLAGLPRDARRRIAYRIDLLASAPRPHGSEKLTGMDGLFRIRVGDYRVIYLVRDDRLLVLVVAIGHRREIYRRK